MSPDRAVKADSRFHHDPAREEFGSLDRNCPRLDAYTPGSLLFVQMVKERQDLQLGCPEEIVFPTGFIGAMEATHQPCAAGKTADDDCLHDLAKGKHR